MSSCPKCAAAIASDARFCTECGTQVSPCPSPDAPGGSNGDADDAASALAAASVCKLKGEWQAAIDKCIYVLALDEDNAAAHSLLGDIYCEQGHLSEAMHWYKLALDLNPDSAVDRARLDRLLTQPHAGSPSQTSRRSELAGTARRVIAEAGLAIGVLLLITTLWPIISRPKEAQEDKPPQHPQTVQLPVTVPDDTPNPQPPAARPLRPLMSRHEDALMQAMNASPALGRRSLLVESITTDPRDRSAVITCACPADGKESADLSLARAALIVLREACFKDNGLDRFTVRVRYDASETATVDVLFVADTRREAVLSINPEAADRQQISGVLQNPWWAPGTK